MRQNASPWRSILLGIHFQFQVVLFILSRNSVKLLALDSNTDRESLLAFRSSVFDPHDALSAWNLSVSHCLWAGVSCSSPSSSAGDRSRVTSLDLPSLRLSGTIPPHLSNLTSLERLNLYNNSFYGKIPTSLANLSSVRTVILARNSISGSLPPELGSLRNLRVLDVSINGLTGEIPRSYGNLSALTTLSLVQNKISGELWDDLRTLGSLVRVETAQNILTGELPPWLFNISSLQYISVTENNLTGKLPGERDAVNITNLRELYLSTNAIGGTIPSSLFRSPKIRVLDLSKNHFEGSLPIPYNLKALTRLHVGHNYLSSNKQVNAQFFDSLTNSTNLEKLFLTSNFLSGELPSSVGNLSLHLQELCVDANSLTGRFPDELERYGNLTALSIFQNSFSGNFPISIGKASKLEKVEAYQNMFSGEIPESFGNLSLLFQLTLGRNRFSGGIPSGLSGCTKMNTLGLAWNELSGQIPREIFRLPSLRTLRLVSNKLTGPIPFELGGLKQLQSLDISGNDLTGSIPMSIGECLVLCILNLSRNNLSDQIPDAISQLRGLESMDLSHNSISGRIPAALAILTTLKKLDLSFNNLEGEVPPEGIFANVTWHALQGNGNLCANDQQLSQKLNISTCAVARRSTNKHHLLAALIPASISVLLLVLGIVWLIWVRVKRSGRAEDNPLPSVKGLPMMISFDEISRATGNFSAENFVGRGGFGSVYRGTFASKIHTDAGDTELPGSGESTITLAVKVIDLGQSKATKSFIAECEALKHARHRNLVKVVTSCSSVDQTGAEFKALVMEFMSNGNLDLWLYPNAGEYDRRLTLDLTQRVSIAIDVASALEYLHDDCEPPVVHCDIKPGNVLLDETLTARLGDFGLARFLSSRDQQEIVESSTVGLKGSIGYMAPEYGMGGIASTCGDVYSFGILLLELFIAKKPTDEMFQQGLNLSTYAAAVSENPQRQILQIIDPTLVLSCCTRSTPETGGGDSSGVLSGQEINDDSVSLVSGNTDQDSNCSRLKRCEEEGIAELINLGLSCAGRSPKDRPAMKEVVAKLHKVKRLIVGSNELSHN
ncbi:hypothetical protein SAY86_019369 [Trapa natans]|uniref:non-specific serine/threonine protein kinase n=1 Tax=Trapa natans TaxID=22666 RepID=A0AAN7LX88_TRANT|nr:hypothetical protein SAY86_019369 [Trapa natans]